MSYLVPASVYHSVLVHLRTSLQQVRDRDAATIFADATLLAHWESLVELVERRLWILEEYNNGALASERRFDDLEVGISLRRYSDPSHDESAPKFALSGNSSVVGGA